MQGANPTLAPYAKEGEVTLRIAAKAANLAEAEALIAPCEAEIRQRLSEYIYSTGEKGMAETVGQLLIEKGLSIACAESCTAGRLTAALGDVSGISAVLSESIVTYSNEAKMKYLGVSGVTLGAYGAVSRETAEEMAKGIAKKAGADIGVSVTGIAGPGGGTEEKPVGLVYVGLAYKGKITSLQLNLHGNRDRIRNSSVLHALNLVRKAVLAE